MRGWLRVLGIELRHGMAPWAALAVAGIVAALLWLDHTSDWGGRWNALGSFMRELVIVLAPVCVTLGAWQGGRGRRARVGELLTSTPRTTLQRLSVEIVALWLAITVGVLAGWASAAWTIALVGGWGTAAAALYVLGLVPTVAAYTAVGYVIGAVAPWRIVAPVAGGAAYAGVGLLTYGSDSLAVAVGAGWLGGANGYPFDLDAWLFSMAALTFVALALWGAVSWERRPGASRRWWAVLVPGIVGTAVLFPLAVQASDSGQDGFRPTSHPLACTPDEPVVCVHAEDQLLLPEMAARARPVLERLASVRGAPTRAVPLGGSSDPTVLGVDPGATTPWGEPDREYGDEMYVDIYGLFSPESYCPTGRFDQAPRPVRRAFRGTADLMAWWFDPASGQRDPQALLEEGGSERGQRLAERFVGSGAQQRDAYAAAVLAAVRECDTASVLAATDLLAPAPTNPTS